MMKNYISIAPLKMVFMLLFIGMNSSLFAQNIPYAEGLHTAQSINDKSINIGLAVGSTPGSGDASSGAASYTIPIAVPPGTGGVVPSVSVSYNSMGGNGQLGMGWGLSGMSAISRVGKNFYHDGEVRAADFSYQDKFALDGKRLILTSTDRGYGESGAKYGTENEDYSEITSYQTDNTITSFKVVTVEGVVMDYGNTTDARIMAGTNVLTWLLNKVTYLNGNYIEYVYSTSTSGLETVISEIKYTGNNLNGLLPYNSVKFDYKTRDDKNFYYLLGVKRESTLLLDRIIVDSKDDDLVLKTFKTYNFTYGFNNNLSYLKEVYETGTNNNGAFNSTAFRYGDAPVAFSRNTIINGIQGRTGRVILGDYNADGYTDIMFITTALLSPGQRYDTGFKIYTRIVGNEDNYTWAYTETLPTNTTIVDKKIIPNNFNFASLDYTGDGYADILITEYEFITGANGQTGKAIKNLFLYENQQYGGTFIKKSLAIPARKYAPSSGQAILGGDFNGDGIQDILAVTRFDPNINLGPNPTPSDIINAQKASPSIKYSGLSTEFELIANSPPPIPGPNYQTAGNWGFANEIQTLDFNADGKTDIMIINGIYCEIVTLEGNSYRQLYYSNSYLSSNHFTYFGDFNGDGKTDILSRKSQTDNTIPWKISYSTGTEFTSEETFTFQHEPNVKRTSNDDSFTIADFDGDSKSDIFHAWSYNSSNSQLDLYYSKGNNAFNKKEHLSGIVSVQDGYPLVGDMNGDGIADIFQVSTLSAEILYFNKERRDHLLQKVRNGILHTTEWNYKRLNDGSAVYIRIVDSQTIQNTYPINVIQSPIRVVSDFRVTNGIGGLATKSYTYQNAILHVAGRGFLGFEETTTSDVAADIFSVSKNQLNTDYYLLLPRKVLSNKLISNISLGEVASITDVISAGARRYRVETRSSSQTNYFEKKTLSISNTFNSNGMLLTSTSKLYGGLNNDKILIEESTNTNIYGDNFGSRIPMKPIKITASKTRGSYSSTPSTERKKMEYDDYGQLKVKIDFADEPKSVRTEYSYDVFGNITQTKLKPSDMAERTASSTYDDKGRFVISSKNVLNQTSYSWYNSFGQVTSTKGIDELTTSFVYDGFGRLTKTTLPTGVEINQSKDWNFDYGATYYNNIQHPGKPDQKTWYDILGRDVRTEIDGKDFITETGTVVQRKIISDKSYTDRGQIGTSSQEHYAPDKGGEAYLITNNIYDSYNRLTESTNYFGKTTVSYSYATDGKMTITTTDPGGRNSSKVMDAAGKTIQSTDNGGTQYYEYDALDKLRSVVKLESNNTLTTLNTSVYDQYGRQTQLVDMSAGTTNYVYDALGQLTSETNAKNQTHNMYYDILGRIILRSGPEGNTTTEYYGTGGAKTNQLKKITGFSGETTEYDYNDGYGRLTNTKERIDNIDYYSSMTYNVYGDLTQKTFPSGLVIKYNYDGNGYLQFIRKGNDQVIFQNTDQNALGQVKSYNLGNGRSSSNSYNYGIPTNYSTGGVQNLSLNWNYATGNLKSRTDYFKNIEEAFEYDNLDRLISTRVRNRNTNTYSDLISMGFAPSGNITSKTDVGNYGYDANKKHTVTSVTNSEGTVPVMTQDIDFTSYERPEKIKENGFELTYTYGADYERIKGVMTQNGNNIYTRYFLGDYEKTIQNGNTKEVHYISSPAGLIAIVVRENGNDAYNYTYTDHLGSILTVEKSDGSLVHQNFDAWGRRRNVDDWTPLPPTANTGLPEWLYRGYTGHEHLDQFGLINMNARLYDPVLGRMISPDNFVNGAFGTQGYNRYSYANNNPLSYVDPSGNFPLAAIGAVLGKIITGAVIAGNVSMFTQGLNHLLTGAPVSGQAVMNSILQGALGAALGFGIGGLFASSELTTLEKLLHHASHAVSGGVQSVIFGGKFGDGAISGLIGSFSGSLSTTLGLSNTLVGNFVIGGTASVITSTITGGDPFQAFITGGTVAAFNDYLHRVGTTIAGIYGAGGERASGNPDLKALVESQGGTMFTSSVGGGDDEIIDFLRKGFERGDELKIYGHSRGGAAAVRIANKLGEMYITITEITLYDPVGMHFGGDFVFKHANVLKVNNYYQRNDVDGLLMWADNPFKGSPVRGNFQWPEINNINLTGYYYKTGELINHLNITRYAIKHP